MTPNTITSYEEFWPFYLKEHSSSLNRFYHYLGTALVHVLVAGALWSADPMYFILAPFAGYGFAWFGHFIIEKNRPATFTYPLWSLYSDFRMFYMACLGKLKPELLKHNILKTDPTEKVAL